MLFPLGFWKSGQNYLLPLVEARTLVYFLFSSCSRSLYIVNLFLILCSSFFFLFYHLPLATISPSFPVYLSIAIFPSFSFFIFLTLVLCLSLLFSVDLSFSAFRISLFLCLPFSFLSISLFFVFP